MSGKRDGVFEFRIQIVLPMIGAVSLLSHCLVSGEPQPLRPGPDPQWVTPPVVAPRLHYQTFHSTVAGTDVSYHIYTPEVYDTEVNQRFPVIYWLHGHQGGLAGFRFLTNHFDTAIRTGWIPPLLVVFPNGMYEGMWCDWKNGRGPIETVVITELIPHIDATYRTIASRNGRLIEGFSMGGYGAARLGFKYSKLFAGISILAGGPLQHVMDEFPPRVSPQTRKRVMENVYGGDIEYFKALSPWELAQINAEALSDDINIRVQIGEDDEMLAVTRQFDAHLTDLAIPHTFTVVPAVGHQPGIFLRLQGESETYWDFYRNPFSPRDKT